MGPNGPKNEAETITQQPLMQPERSSKNTSHSVGFSALLMAMGTFSSRILGFVRDMITAAYFSRTVTDAWLVAFRLPNLFRRIFGEGALSVAFVPVYVETREKLGTEHAKKVASAVFSLLLTVLLVLFLVGIIYMRPIIEALTPGDSFAGIPGKVELTVELARIMFIFVVLVCLYAYYMAILNSVGKFGLAAFAPTLFNIAMIASAYFDYGSVTDNGHILAWAVVVGGVLQMALLIPPLMSKGLLPGFTLHWNIPEVRQIFLNMGPSLIGLSIMQITIIVNTRFASYLPEGANSWIFWADRLLELPLSLFAVSLGTALLPTLSQQWSRGDKILFSQTANYYLRSVLALSFPAAVGIYFLAEPIVRVLFERGKFTINDTQNTALILSIYSTAIITYSVVRVLAPAYYAIKNTWLPALASLSGLVLHLVLAPHFIDIWQLKGLILSTIISSVFNMFILLGAYSYIIGEFDFTKLFVSVCKFCVASAAMAGVVQVFFVIENPIQGFFANILSGWSEYLSQTLWVAVTMGSVVALALTIILSATTYFVMAYFLRSEEVKPIIQRILRKLLR